MTTEKSDVIWNSGLQRFQDVTSRAMVSFRDAAERVRVIEIGPNNFRLQDATGRFVGIPQFNVSSEFSWISPNKGYIRFCEEVKPHVVGEPSLWTVNKITEYTYMSEGEVIGLKHASLGYGMEYSINDLDNEKVLLEGYKTSVALELGIDIERIDQVGIKYLEYRYYTPLK